MVCESPVVSVLFFEKTVFPPSDWPSNTYLLNIRAATLYPSCPTAGRRNIWGGPWPGVGFRHIIGEGKVGRMNTYCLLCHRPHAFSSSLPYQQWSLTRGAWGDMNTKFLRRLVKFFHNKVCSLFVLYQCSFISCDKCTLSTLVVIGRKTYRNSLYNLCNFSINLKLSQHKNL